ncbi:ankyrin repeat-containing domain protein, partial [Baffinella frigidus]
SPLHLASAEGHLQVVEFLVLYGANVNSRDRWGGDPLKDAMRGGHAKVGAEWPKPKTQNEQVQQVLKLSGARGVNDDHSDHMNMGDKMANVGAADYDKRSALHLAAAEGHYEVVCFLVENKADVTALDRWGKPQSPNPKP